MSHHQSVQEGHPLLSDSHRLSIIEAHEERPRQVPELARLLRLRRATVRAHLQRRDAQSSGCRVGSHEGPCPNTGGDVSEADLVLDGFGFPDRAAVLHDPHGVRPAGRLDVATVRNLARAACYPAEDPDRHVAHHA